jgi:hypothetical protein
MGGMTMNKFIVPLGNQPDVYVINGVRYVVSSKYQKPDFKDLKQNTVLNDCVEKYLTSDFADLTIENSSSKMMAEYVCSAVGKED